MSVYLGNTEIGQMFLGSTEIGQAYLGSTKVWESEQSLPYDAEIDYLESTGTQWINTLVKQKDTKKYLSVNVNIRVPILESDEHDIVGSGNYSTPTMGYKDANYFMWSYTSTSWYPKSADTSWHNTTYTFNVGKGRTFSEDGIIYTQDTFTNNFINGQYNSLFIFASGPNRHTLKCQLRSVNIVIDDILQFDAIPVRVGRVGYLYDKVSGQLFANAGSGNFILGNDKTT